MRISAFSGKAQAFVNGKWTGWMPYDEAKALEMQFHPQVQGKKRIFLVDTPKGRKMPSANN